MGAALARFECALEEITARVFNAGEGGASRAIAVAYSGGLDSSVLLHLVQKYVGTRGIALQVFHVHHGLSPHADAWLAHCVATAAALGVGFDMRRVTVHADGNGIESAARRERYAALGTMCRAHGTPLLLTAHHEDDQAETVLLQLLRGSGIAGLSGMDSANHAPALLGDATTCMARPMLTIGRATLQEVASQHQIAHVEDPSNSDPRHARNALRAQVMPVLESHFPGFAGRFARTARHAQSAQQLLIELAAQDLAHCTDTPGDADGSALRLDYLRGISAARSDNLLRYWFGSRGMRMPSTAWLEELRSQLLDAKADAQVLVRHPECDLHRHRNRIVMTPRRPLPDPERDVDEDAVSFVWAGQNKLPFADFGGVLHFAPSEKGVDAAWLRSQTLKLQSRSGGWRLKLAGNRSTRSLKYHYQAPDIPAWERSRLPLVVCGKELVFAAGLGIDCKFLSEHAGPRITLRWQADAD
ncbi:MAG: tRNA lysidine(34) synthetase TilS [Herminiimonas sp.]|nr:tRNA lysidine(34) synthetase TilS [Herminiimonas sp.]